jgi:peroxiredoxin Q/BCP
LRAAPGSGRISRVLRKGDSAPDFELPDSEGRKTTLRELLANGPAVLFFYPGDFTPVCTREVCMVRDLYGDLQAAGVAVAGISADSVASHARFKAQHDLPYRLLADPEKNTVRAYGVGGPLGFGVRRATFVVGRDGTIRDVVSALLSVGRHERFLRNAIEVAHALT